MHVRSMLSLSAIALLVPLASAAEEYELKPQVPAPVEQVRAPQAPKHKTETPSQVKQEKHANPAASLSPTSEANEIVAPRLEPTSARGTIDPPPAVVWTELLMGNARYVLDRPSARDLVTRRRELIGGQHPRTIVLSCSDSRVPPELIFDQSIGDLFVVRTAGEVVDAIAAASVEYAVEHLGAELVVVLGHEKCGAVTAALSNEQMPSPSLGALMDHIRPSVARVSAGTEGDERLRRAIEANVDQSAHDLLATSAIVRERVARGSLLLVEAMYALGGGEVRELARCTASSEVPAITPPPPPIAESPKQDAAPPIPGITPEVKQPEPPSKSASAPQSGSAPEGKANATRAAAAPIAWEASMRFRYETRSMLDYRVPGTYKRAAAQKLLESGDQSLMRTRIGAGLKLASGVKGMIVLQDARVMGAEGSPGGMIDNVDLFQAYADIDSIGGRPLALRAGRQVFQYGDGRVLAGSEWGNAGRAWDGARLRYTPERWQVDGFLSWVNEGRLAGVDRLLSGANAQWKPTKQVEVEGYSIQRAFGDAAYTSEDGHAGRIHDATHGARARVSRGRAEWKSEAAIQRGRRASDTVRSWFAATRASMELPGDWKPRAQLEWVGASGDRTPADGRTQRYDPLYWSGHSYLGALDVAGCSNMSDVNGGVTVQPWKRGSASAELHRFHLMQAKDAWADDSGTILRRAADGHAGTDLGTELDLGFKWDPRPRLGLTGGWSRFWRGDFVKQTGGGKDLSWGYLQLALSL